jgi:CRISPR-associated endoribonuclease Cas6
MYHVTVTFQPTEAPLDGRYVTAKGLHGLLFKALQQADPTETDWLHDHAAPKPFSLAPLYADGGTLAGVRLGAVSPRAAQLFVRAWEWQRQRRRTHRLGPQPFQVDDITCVAGPTWADLAAARPVRRVTLDFLSPTTFKQGPGHLPLPVPVNVFGWPWRVWQAYGPPIELPEDWLEWCRRDLFVVEHQLETVLIQLNRDDVLSGFVGRVVFETRRGTREQLGLLHALAWLAGYSGVGHKTTMGMGAVAPVTSPGAA